MYYVLWKTLITLPWGPETYVVLRISWLLPSAFPPPPPQPIAERDKKHCYPRYHHFRKLNEHHFKFPFFEDNR